jgi:hypothetical protein
MRLSAVVPLLLVAVLPFLEAFATFSATSRRPNEREIFVSSYGVKESQDEWLRQKGASTITIARQAALSLAAVMFLSQQFAVAVAPETYGFNHEYADPTHPECKQTFQVNKVGRTFKYTGTAVGDANDSTPRGCSY